MQKDARCNMGMAARRLTLAGKPAMIQKAAPAFASSKGHTANDNEGGATG